MKIIGCVVLYNPCMENIENIIQYIPLLDESQYKFNEKQQQEAVAIINERKRKATESDAEGEKAEDINTTVSFYEINNTEIYSEEHPERDGQTAEESNKDRENDEE